VTSHGHHPRLATDSAGEASLARWLVRHVASGEVPVIVEQVRGLVVAAQAQARTEPSVTVDVVKFGHEHLRVPSRSSKDTRERMLATWRAEVLANPGHRDRAVLAGLAERITNRRHEVALVVMLEHRAATGRSSTTARMPPCTGRSDEPGPLGPPGPTGASPCSVSVCSPTWRACRGRYAPAPWWSSEGASATGEARCTI
jgi:hypothetical protein